MALLGVGLVLLLSSAPVSATHDKAHAFAGNWTIDPGGTPGQLQLRVVGEGEGLAAFEAIGRSVECLPVASYYAGTFTTPTDSGPVAGCTEQNRTDDFKGYYDSINFRGVGKLNILLERLSGGLKATAFVTAPGQPVPVFGGTPIPLRFDGHFAGDGAGGGGPVRVAFEVDATHRDAKAKAAGLTVISRTDGSGILEGNEDGTLSPAQRNLIVIQHRDATLTGRRVHAVDLAVLSGRLRKNRRELALNVQVIESSDRSCREGAHGTIVMEHTDIQVGFSGGPRITTAYCGHSDLTLSSDPIFSWEVDDLEGIGRNEVRVLASIRTKGRHRTSPNGRHLGPSESIGSGKLQGPTNGKLYLHGGKLFLIRHKDSLAPVNGGGELRLTLAAGSGQLQFRSAREYTLVLVVRVVESDDRKCPEGRTGTVLMRRDGDDYRMVVDVCQHYDTTDTDLRNFPFSVRRTLAKAD